MSSVRLTSLPSFWLALFFITMQVAPHATLAEKIGVLLGCCEKVVGIPGSDKTLRSMVLARTGSRI